MNYGLVYMVTSNLLPVHIRILQEGHTFSCVCQSIGEVAVYVPLPPPKYYYLEPTVSLRHGTKLMITLNPIASLQRSPPVLLYHGMRDERAVGLQLKGSCTFDILVLQNLGAHLYFEITLK